MLNHWITFYFDNHIEQCLSHFRDESYIGMYNFMKY